mgnify:FL=1|tara:strand:- start:148 stop:732 length:585 start_codon:yes stop_codon:yes gene_type:complete
MINVDLKVVICHYNQDLGWISDLKHDYVIYNKNPNNNGKYDFDLPNVGFDTIVYLKFIIDNYDDLPDYVCFSQDDPFYHCPEFTNNVNNFNGEEEFLPLGITYVRDNEQTLKQTINYADTLGIEYEEPIKFINSCQSIVSKNLIRKRSKESYKKIKDSLPKNAIINNTNYIVEYLWPTIMNFNSELVVSYNNCK